MEALEQQLAIVREDLGGIKESVAKIAEAMTRMAVLEERNASVAILVDKITARVERMEDRQQDNAVFHAQVLATKEELAKVEARTTNVEVSQIKTDTTVKVVTNSVRGAWAALSLAVLGGAFKLFGLHPV